MDLSKNLRLEIEVPTTGLKNLVVNPSGELGAWGWVTPVANTTLSATHSPDLLTFKTNTAQAAYWTTEFMPVAAGQYAAASFDALSGSGATYNVKVRFEWYNSARTLLASSTQSAAFASSNTRYFYAAQQAPANTAFMKLRFDFYNGSGNPAANSTFTFSGVTVAAASSLSALTSTITNLVTNPSFEAGMNGWDSNGAFGAYVPATISQTTEYAQYGTKAAKVVFPASGRSWINTFVDGLTIGETYTISGYAIAPGTSLQMGVDSLFNSATAQASMKTVSNGRVRLTLTFTASSTGHFVGFFTDNGAGKTVYIDSVMVTKGPLVPEIAYFDGSVVAASGNYSGGTIAWTGTAHASTSTYAISNLPYIEPIEYLDILGPTSEININRKELDVGMLSATLHDANLDPSLADSIVRPGRKVRVVAQWQEEEVEDAFWYQDTLFSGVISSGKSTYDRNKGTGVTVTITATDNVSVLANQGENRVLSNVADLPLILEGKGVPWNINGNGNQVASGTVVAYNDNASVLDQVYITRDTNQAYAFVDRTGVLNVKSTLDTTQVAGFTDNIERNGGVSYSAIDADFSTEDCINNVTVKFLRYNVGTGETTEVAYGPYKNQSSIDTWGARSAEFTIAGATENATAIQNFAQSVLNKNSVPKRKVNSLTWPVQNQEYGFQYATAIDLYSPVAVTLTDNGQEHDFATLVSGVFVVTGIEHSISATTDGGRWNVTYTFADTGSVAAPTFIPSPPFNGVTDTGWQLITPAAGWTHGTSQAQYRIDEVGRVWLRGHLTRTSGTTVAMGTISNTKGHPTQTYNTMVRFGTGVIGFAVSPTGALSVASTVTSNSPVVLDGQVYWNS